MSEEQFFKDKPGSNILAQIVHRYLPFWPVYVIVTALSLSIAYIYLRAQTKIYVAASKVLLKDPQKGGGDSKVLDALNIFSEKKIVENEVIVLRSTSLMQEVVKELDLYTTIYNEGKVQIEELYKDNSPITFIALNKDSIIGSGKYKFDIDWNNAIVSIDKRNIPFNGILTLGKTQYVVKINSDYNRNVIGKNYFAVFNSVAAAASAIIGPLKAGPQSFSSTVLDVTMETPVPEKGKDILNKLFEIYNKEAIQDKNQIANNTINFIEDRLNTVIRQLDSVERNIQDYKSREAVTDLGAQASMYFGSVKELEKRKSSLDLQLDILKDIETYVNSKGRKPGTVPSLMLVSDPTLSGLLQQLYGAEFELEKAKSVTGEKSEKVLLGEEKITRIKDDIRENLNNIRANFVTEVGSINSNIAKNNVLLSSVPQKERGLLEISRQQVIKNNIYTYLLQKREETALSSASTTADLKVLEKGFAYGPIRPVNKNYYLMGLLIGLLSFFCTFRRRSNSIIKYYFDQK